MKKQKSGFTLAEVLITMSIIGIIAAIIMPSLISSYQYKTIGVKLSKFLASTEQASRAYVVSNDSFGSSTEDDRTRILDFANDSFIFREIVTGSNTEEYQKKYLDVQGLSDAQKAQTYVFDIAADAKAANDTSFTSALNSEPSTNVGRLKDGTLISITPVKPDEYTQHKAAVDQAKIGLPAMNIAFSPKVSGLPSTAQKTYNFVVTELGYVVPNDNDSCLWKIYNDEFKTNAKTFTHGATEYCNNGGTAQSWSKTTTKDTTKKD